MTSGAAAQDPSSAVGLPTRFALTAREHRRLADVLLQAMREHSPIVPLTRDYPELTIADARKIRDLMIESRLAAGERIIGAKLSLGGHDPATYSGEPRLGWLTESMLLQSSEVALAGLISPRVQPKVALRLGRPLRTPLATLGELVAAIDRVLPCLEIVDGRYEPGTSEPVDEIADNCAAAGLVVGKGIDTPGDLELRRMSVDVRIESDAAEAVSWRAPRPCSVEPALRLANSVIEEGREIDAGGLLVSAMCAPSAELRASSRVHADFGALGCVSIQTRKAGSEA